MSVLMQPWPPHWFPLSPGDPVSDSAQRHRGGFEPLRAEPNGFRVHHLSHSVTLSTSSQGLASSVSDILCYLRICSALLFLLTYKFSFLKSHMCAMTKALKIECTISTARGFEPLRAEPNGFLVHHLSHSVTLSMYIAMIVT